MQFHTSPFIGSPTMALDPALSGLSSQITGLDTLGVGIVVVFWKSADAGDIVTETGDDIEPWLRVVDTEGNKEGFLALLCLETDDARGAGASDGEDWDVVLQSPSATVGVVPDALLDDSEVGVLVGLVETEFDCVAHAVESY